MKIAFIVGSFIHPYAGGSPSSYTVNERVDQTHKTLKSIREKCPDATIFFIEGSTGSIDSFQFDYDVLVRPTNDPLVKDMIYGNMKSIGECMMMIFTGKNITLEDYDLVFKISGRYELTDTFSLDTFSQQKFTFYDHIQWGYETTLYSFPGKLKNVWIDCLERSISFMSKNKMDSVEIALRALMNVKYVCGVDKLGIQGYNAPMKRFIKY